MVSGSLVSIEENVKEDKSGLKLPPEGRIQTKLFQLVKHIGFFSAAQELLACKALSDSLKEFRKCTRVRAGP